MAINSVTQGLLSAGCEVKVLTVCTDKHPIDYSKLPDSYKQSTQIESVYINTKIRPTAAAKALLCGESYHVKRYESAAFEGKIVEVLKQGDFDVVHVESVFLTPYVETIRRYCSGKVVLRAHNVEHKIWQQLAKGERNMFKRWYLKHLALSLEVYERDHVNDYDGVICITDQDAETFRSIGCRKPIISVPFAIEPQEAHIKNSEPYSLFHIGSMDWKPNIEAIDWFLKDVWPMVHKELPQVKLYLAGRHMQKRLQQLRIEGVQVVGEVENAVEFMKGKQINVVPLLSASGIRVKILEAMSIGKVVIATSVASRGIRYSDGENILIANSPAEFVKQIKRCIEDECLMQKIGGNARSLVKEVYDESNQAAKMIEFYKFIIG